MGVSGPGPYAAYLRYNQLFGRVKLLNREAAQLLAKRPLVIELFAGVGGLSLGLEQAGFHVCAAVEIEEIAGRYAQYNSPLTNVFYGDDLGDVRKFGRERFLSVLGATPKEIALVAGGPPCQGFSLAGKKQSADPLNGLIFEFVRVVFEFMPLAFLVENVPGIKNERNPQLYAAIDQLATHYDVTAPKALFAHDFGVPQARQRVFVVGIRKDLNIRPTFPCPSHCRPSVAQTDFFKSLPITPTVWEALSDIPDVDAFDELIDGDRIPYPVEPQTVYQRIMRGHEKDLVDRSPSPVWDKGICTNLRRTRHGEDLLQRLSSLAFGKADKISGIRRLDPAEVATTIRAGTTKERGAWSAPRPLHPYFNRVLTTRECARLQSFPDHMFFHPTKWHGNRMVGNAVPPLLAKAIGNHLMHLLGLERAATDLPQVYRDETLVQQDIEEAANSGLSRHNVSQKVIHPRKLETLPQGIGNE